MAINIRELSKFLVESKINTYASSGEEGEKVLRDGSKEFRFEKGKFKYKDRYFGFNPFIGEETVFYNGEIIWGMNYYGEVISDVISIKRIYKFLRECLKKTPESKPFRGPEHFEKNDFRYINKVDGIIKRFSGHEKIFYKKELVYKLNYHGGLIIKKSNI